MTGSGAGPVLTREAPSTPIRRLWRAEHVWHSLWCMPLIVVTVSLVIAPTALAVDEAVAFDPSFALLSSDPDVVAAVSTTVAAGMLTFLAVVFSSTLVAVQLASSQFSPRIVRVFVRSRITQATISIFLATFVTALTTMVAVRSDHGATELGTTITMLWLLVLATVVVFVAFMHRIVRLLRVQYLLLSVSREAAHVLAVEFPSADAYRPRTRPLDDPGRVVRYRGRPGAVQAVDRGGLCAAALAAGCWIELLVGVGEQVGHATPIARIHGPDAALTDEALISCLLVGGERTFLQDPAFGLRQLVDTAARALSPAVNDPTTAVQALQRIVDLLARVAERPDATGWFSAPDGSVRLHMPHRDFERLARLGLTEILRYGADAPQVTRALRAAYDDLDAVVPAHHRAVVAALRAEWEAAVPDAMPAAFLPTALAADRMGMG